ncbi:Mediator of RNA polymerase II transcription subunit 16 [Acorus gramineus]|uniref:Mediator of RNA polymerase II transcription subunit 16 n=1 Tax=Acorus gramineus TaxID=55184 RepID=A0AAV9AAD6_ACOGR|nr:Mediator of RNA polymerase II transcription subunit 16 [Acorus gramineus]
MTSSSSTPTTSSTTPPPPTVKSSVSSEAAAEDGGERPSAGDDPTGGGVEGEDGVMVAAEAATMMKMEEDPAEVPDPAGSPATVFQILLKQHPSNLRHKMSVPKLCRNFSAVAWCGRLNTIACASETCARIPRFTRKGFNFHEWMISFSHLAGRGGLVEVDVKGPVNMVRDASSWKCEHEWRQDLAIVTKWMSGMTPWPPTQSDHVPKWFSTSKGLLGAGPSGIMAADAIITEAGTMHVAGVPLVNPSTIVVWEVTPGPGNAFQATAKTSTSSGIPALLSPPSWTGFAPLASYLFSWQEYLGSEEKQGKKQTDQEFKQTVSLNCSPVSNFSAYVSPEVADQSAATTTWGSGVTSVAFDPTRGGSVISVVIVEGQYMSPYDPEEGPSITGWRVQFWESSLQPVALHPIFGNPASTIGGQPPMQTVWLTRVNKSIPPMGDLKCPQAASAVPMMSDGHKPSDSSAEKENKLSFDLYDLPSDVRMLAQIVYSAHGGEVAVAFLRGGVHIFSGSTFAPVDSYHINIGPSIAAPAFSSTGCCLASVWHDTSKDQTTLKIIRVLPPAVPSSQTKLNSAAWERAIADSFSQSLDRIKCRLLEGTNAQDVRALVLDMQARLLLDMLGKGIESALINPSSLVPEPWQDSGEMLSGIDGEKMAVEPALVPCILAYVDAVLDLSSHFITRLRRYASFCRTLATHGVGVSAGAGSTRNVVAPSNSSTTASTNQVGGQSGGTSSTGGSQMQARVQGAAKISSTADGVSSSAPNPIGGPAPFMPISINTGTFPGTPAVRLIGDCHFLHRLCQLLLFCLIFRKRQLLRHNGGPQKNLESNLAKPHIIVGAKVEESSNLARSTPAMTKLEEGQSGRAGQFVLGAKGIEEGTAGRPLRFGHGNAGQGYTSDENMPRPRGADAAGLLLRELELHPPAEEWHRRNMFGGPWSDPEDLGPLDSSDLFEFNVPEGYDNYYGPHGLWPKRRRLSERDAAFGLKTSVGLGSFLGIMGSRRDVVTALWKTGLDGIWYKCVRCMRQTSAFSSPGDPSTNAVIDRQAWWISRWAYGCPMCGGTWVRVI